MRVRITFKDGLEMLSDIELSKDSDGNWITPLEFVTGRPDCPENVWVREADSVKNQYKRLPHYVEYDRKVLL